MTSNADPQTPQDPVDLVEGAKALLVEYATGTLPPIGVNISLIVSGQIYVGQRVSTTDFVEHVKTYVLKATQGARESKNVLAVLSQVDTSALEIVDDEKHVYFQCERIVTLNGLNAGPMKLMLRIPAHAVEAMAFGALSITPQP